MKKTLTIIAMLALVGGILAGCAPREAEPASEPQQQDAGQTQEESMTDAQGQELIYRGRIDSLSDDSIIVTQLEGFDYGQPSIMFHITGDTITEDSGMEWGEGAFVEVSYDGRLTRSIPAQGTALTLTVLSTHSEGIIKNGEIVSVAEAGDGYTITLMPFDAQSDNDIVLLNVPGDALEELSAEELVEGLKVCAITRGIAALSMPPQMPVYKLMPYSG